MHTTSASCNFAFRESSKNFWVGFFQTQLCKLKRHPLLLQKLSPAYYVHDWEWPQQHHTLLVSLLWNTRMSEEWNVNTPKHRHLWKQRYDLKINKQPISICKCAILASVLVGKLAVESLQPHQSNSTASAAAWIAMRQCKKLHYRDQLFLSGACAKTMQSLDNRNCTICQLQRSLSATKLHWLYCVSVVICMCMYQN